VQRESTNNHLIAAQEKRPNRHWGPGGPAHLPGCDHQRDLRWPICHAPRGREQPGRLSASFLLRGEHLCHSYAIEGCADFPKQTGTPKG
jgi:hypothetical protein